MAMLETEFRLEGRTPLAHPKLRDDEQRQELEEIIRSELDDVLDVDLKTDRVAPASMWTTGASRTCWGAY